MSPFSTNHPYTFTSAVDDDKHNDERDWLLHRHRHPRLHRLSRSTLFAFAGLLRFPSSSYFSSPPFTFSSDEGSDISAAISLPESWLAAQRHAIATKALPKELCSRPRGGTLLKRMRRVFGTAGAGAGAAGASGGVGDGCQSSSALLCPVHAGLDADVVGFWIGLVRAEVTVRCDVIRAGVRLLRRKRRMAEAGRVGEVVEVLNEVAGFVLDDDELELEKYDAVGKGVRAGCTSGRIESGCAACVLAVVGGRREVLVSLRANMKAREKGREPRLVRLVEAWMEVAGWREGREMMAESEHLAEEVRDVRRWMHERKVRKRAERGGGDDRNGRRRRHCYGLPSKARVAGGIPQVRLRDQRHHVDRQHDFRPIYGLDGAADFDPSILDREPSGGQNTWPPSVSLDVNDDAKPNLGFVPARSHWPRTDYTSAAHSNLPPGCHTPQQHGRETVHAFLDQPWRHTGAGHAPKPHHSTVTDWGDIYRGGPGWL